MFRAQDAEARPKFPHIIEVLRRLMANEMAAKRSSNPLRRNSNLSDERQNSGVDIMRTGGSDQNLQSGTTNDTSAATDQNLHSSTTHSGSTGTGTGTGTQTQSGSSSS